eukprot:7223539-Alexandrium_andersonii.AAC.1
MSASLVGSEMCIRDRALEAAGRPIEKHGVILGATLGFAARTASQQEGERVTAVLRTAKRVALLPGPASLRRR